MTPEQSSPPRSPGPPGWLVGAAAVGGRLLVLGLLVWLLAAFAVRLTLVLVPVLVALLLAGVLAPVVQWLADRRVPRWVAAGAVVLLLMAALAGATAGLGARVSGELPQLRDQLQSTSSDLSETLGVPLPFAEPGAGSSGSGGASSSTDLPFSLAGSAEVVTDVLVGLFLTLVLTFLFLEGGAGMWRWLLDKLGGRVQEDVDAAGRAAWGTVGSYVRGLTVVALFDALGIGLGLLLLGVPLALTLAALQFLGSYVPTFGALVAGAVAVVVAYVDGGLGTALLVLLLVVVVQQVGNDVIEPYVMGRELPINGAVVLLAVTAGGVLWGIAGALLFVPLAAAVSAAAHEVWVRHGSRPVAGG